MIDFDMYQDYLNTRGNNLSEVRKHDSAMIMNATFTGSVGYKRVYILDPKDGWIWTDAKYSRHSRQSISSDAVDYYLEFRPFEHHPIGTYVFIPDDTSNDVGFADEMPINPFKDDNFEDIFNLGRLWILVDRNQEREFVRYMALQCNWNYKWVHRYNGVKKVLHCYGSIRNANSYTAGVWDADYSSILDTVNSYWMPNTYFVLSDNLDKYEIDDTRYITIDTRFAMSLNKIYPQCWRVTKIDDVTPKGILKLTFKRDEWNDKRDNQELMICDYYDDSGSETIDLPINEHPSEDKTSTLSWAILNNNTKKIEKNDTELVKHLAINENSYFVVDFSDENVISNWSISYSDNNADNISNEDKDRLCNLLKITKHSNTAISIKPGKSKELIGKLFNLTVQDSQGEYKSIITDMEVRSNG